MRIYPTSKAFGGPVKELPKDQVFTLLASHRRRFVLHYLQRIEGAADLSEMATWIAAWENDTSVEELTPGQRKRVYTSLQQTHLRKLDEAGIVEYDSEAGRVHPTEAADELEVYLEIVPGREFPWREYYLALGAISCALAIVVWQGLYPFSLVPEVAWTGLIAGVLTVSAVAHVYHERNMRLGADERPPDAGYTPRTDD